MCKSEQRREGLCERVSKAKLEIVLKDGPMREGATTGFWLLVLLFVGFGIYHSSPSANELRYAQISCLSTEEAQTNALRVLLQTKMVEYTQAEATFAAKDQYFSNAAQDDMASGRPPDEIEINRRRAVEAKRYGLALGAVVEVFKVVVNQPTKADMVATMEHYVLEFGREQAKRAREGNAATDPSQQEQIDTEGKIDTAVVTFLNDILAEVKC